MRELILQPKQLEIGKLMYTTGPEAPTWIGGGGARAGGKSGGLRRIMWDRRQHRPGTLGVIVRRVYEELKRNHIDMYLSEFPELRDCYRVGDKEFVLPNGSRIGFMYAENQQEVDRKFWGVEIYDLFIDQAEQFSEYELNIMHSANRWPNTKLGECKTGLFFNPGGVGTEFLRRVFAQKKFHANERPSDYAFVHLFGWDNYVWFQGLDLTPKQFYALSSEERFELFVEQTTEGRKLNGLPPSLRAGHLLGSFESFAGQYFAGVWDESKLILTAEQERLLIQPWWPCLVAGTLIATEHGEVPIEQVQVGDKVWTRKGLRRVLRAWQSGKDKAVLRATFSDGRELVATPNHEILSNGSFLALDAMSIGDRINVWNPSISMAENIPSIESDTTNPYQPRSIVMSGLPITVQFPMVFISTIKTATEQTTTYPIWNVFLPQNISVLPLKALEGLTRTAERCLQELRNGGLRTKERHTSKHWAKLVNWLLGPRSMKSYVKDVDRPRGAVQTLISARLLAIRTGGGVKDWMTSRNSAKFVEQYSNQATATKYAPVQEVVDSAFVSLEKLEPYGKADVYDLAVEGEHEFYANGVLVHNCWMSHDDGFVHHASVSWWKSGKVSPKLFQEVFGVQIPEPVEVAIIYRNHAEQEIEQGELIRKCAAQMSEQEIKMCKRYFLSVDAWERDSKGHSTKDTINEELRRAGLPWAEQADNGRIGGWRFLYAMMKKTADVLDGKMNPTRTDEDYESGDGGYSAKTPLLFISGDCTDVIEAIPMAIRDNKHPGRAEDVLKMPTESDDILDDIRYGAKSMLAPTRSAPLEVRAKEYYDALPGTAQSKYIAMMKFENDNKRKKGATWAGR